MDGVAIALGPGLGPCLRVGATASRTLSTALDIPLVPVNHAVGHVEIGCLTSRAKDPLVLLVSGGHTAILAFAGHRWRIYGETEDITLGNILDMFAREAGLSSPGGPHIEKLAQSGGKLLQLPYVVKGNDVSYSGLLTECLKRLSTESLEDLCFSLQEYAFSMLAEAVERSLAQTKKGELLLVGGVAANQRLQDKLGEVARQHSARFECVDQKYTGDCGAQIAWTGVCALRAGVKIPVERSFVRPKWRLDSVQIPWRTEMQ